MNFFKKLFSRKNKQQPKTPVPSPPASPVPAVSNTPVSNFTLTKKNEAVFHKRFRPMTNEDDTKLLDGAVKMIGSYAMVAKVTLPNKTIVNHPDNLDHAIRNGYIDWMKSVGMEDGGIAAQLGFALSEYLIKTQDMILYHDHLPEHKFRIFALKKNIAGKLLSVFPLEFIIKTMEEGASFSKLEKLIIKQSVEK